MSKPPKSASGKKPEAKAPKAEKPKPAAKAKKAPKAKMAVEPAEVEADGPASKPVAAKATAAGAGDTALAKRLPEMTDFQLRAYQMSTARISRDASHAKSGSAKGALKIIEAEIARRSRTSAPPSPPREPVASPKPGKKRND